MKKLLLICGVSVLLAACHCECKSRSCSQKVTVKPVPATAKPAPRNTVQRQAKDLEQVGTVRQTGNVLQVTYRDPILFDNNKDTIKSGSYKQIDDTAKILKKYPNSAILIEGHTDSTGNADYNVDLSQRRAKSVADALIARGVHPNNVTSQGYGAAQPIASNATKEGRAANRRVELKITTNN